MIDDRMRVACGEFCGKRGPIESAKKSARSTVAMRSLSRPADERIRFLLVSLGRPSPGSGPIIMNTRAELRQAPRSFGLQQRPAVRRRFGWRAYIRHGFARFRHVITNAPVNISKRGIMFSPKYYAAGIQRPETYPNATVSLCRLAAASNSLFSVTTTCLQGSRLSRSRARSFSHRSGLADSS